MDLYVRLIPITQLSYTMWTHFSIVAHSVVSLCQKLILGHAAARTWCCMLYECCSLDWPYSLLLDLAWTTLAVTEMDGASSGESLRGLPSFPSSGHFLHKFWHCYGMLLHQVYVPYIAACHMWVCCLNMYITTAIQLLAAVKCGCIPVRTSSIK